MVCLKRSVRETGKLNIHIIATCFLNSLPDSCIAANAKHVYIIQVHIEQVCWQKLPSSHGLRPTDTLQPMPSLPIYLVFFIFYFCETPVCKVVKQVLLKLNYFLMKNEDKIFVIIYKNTHVIVNRDNGSKHIQNINQITMLSSTNCCNRHTCSI